MKKKIFLFLILTFVCFFFNYFIHYTTSDEIWSYGFSYNIAKGAIPYKDFNMVVLPLYSLLMAIPLRIIANKLIIYHLFNAILTSFIIMFVADKNKLLSICLILYCLTLPCLYGYNQFIMLIVLLILYIEKSSFKYKEEIVGILLGCVLATKQNIGIMLFIPYILHSKKKIKSIIYYLIPITVICIYLIFNNALFECIDYCFLGLSNFTPNLIINQWSLVGELAIVIYLIMIYRKTKDINYLYLLFFQIVNYPLFEEYHFIISSIPVLYYFVIKQNNIYVYIIFIFLAIFMITTRILSEGIYNSKLDSFKHRNLGLNIDNNINEVTKFIKKNTDKELFIFNRYSYLIKINLNQELNKYDLINKGNMGKDENKYIREIDNICKNKKCVFIMDKKDFKNDQLNDLIKDYVIDNYKECSSQQISYYCN